MQPEDEREAPYPGWQQPSDPTDAKTVADAVGEIRSLTAEIQSLTRTAEATPGDPSHEDADVRDALRSFFMSLESQRSTIRHCGDGLGQLFSIVARLVDSLKLVNEALTDACERIERLEGKGAAEGAMANARERGILLLQMAENAAEYKDPQALESYLESQMHALTPRAVAAVLLYCAEIKRENARLKGGGQ